MLLLKKFENKQTVCLLSLPPSAPLRSRNRAAVFHSVLTALSNRPHLIAELCLQIYSLIVSSQLFILTSLQDVESPWFSHRHNAGENEWQGMTWQKTCQVTWTTAASISPGWWNLSVKPTNPERSVWEFRAHPHQGVVSAALGMTQHTQGGCCGLCGAFTIPSGWRGQCESTLPFHLPSSNTKITISCWLSLWERDWGFIWKLFPP